MLNKIFHFIKYNNATVVILAVILILGGGALAAGPEAIGEKQISVQGIDNTALLAADFNAFNMDFKIENIEQDEKYYYAAYSYLNLVVLDKVWQYQLNSRTQKISKKVKEDLGEYLAKFLAKHYEARIRELKRARTQAASAGEQKRVEITEYSGLIGRTLNLAAKVFPGYEPVVKRELPAPEFIMPSASFIKEAVSGTDNLNKIYNDYVDAHPEIFAAPSVFIAPAQVDVDMASGTVDSVNINMPPPVDNVIPETSVVTEAPGILEPESVDIIELPAAEPTLTPAENAPAE